MSEPAFGQDGYRTEQEVRRWSDQIQQKAQRYQEMQAEVSRVSVTESARDGMVRVTVDSSGVVTALEISDGGRELPGTELSDLVLTTMRRAQSRITEQVAEVMTRTVGDDPQTVAAVVDSYRQRFPEPEPEPERPSAVEEMRLGDVTDDDNRGPTPPQAPPVPPARRPRRPDDEDDNEWGDPPIMS